MGRAIRNFKVVLIVVMAAIFSTTLAAWGAPRRGQAAPPFKAIAISGQPVSLESFRGRVLILDFFATWCQPCRFSIPHLVEMNKKYNKQGLQVLGLSVDEQGERTVSAFISDQHINYPVALAGDALLADYGVRAVPVMYLIDKKGNVAEVYRGYNDDIERSIEQQVKKMLTEK